MQRETFTERVLDDPDGYASSNASTSTSSVENSPAVTKRPWPHHLSPRTSTKWNGVSKTDIFTSCDDIALYFTALSEAAVANGTNGFEELGAENGVHPASEVRAADAAQVSRVLEDGLSKLKMGESEDVDLNLTIRLVAPDGEVVKSVISPFSDIVHYNPQVSLEDYSVERLSESDIVFSKEFAQLNVTCRVLSMALDLTVPLLDRFKFLCLVSFYLDEHFSKRLGNFPRLDPHDLEKATINLRRQVRPPTKYEEELTLALRAIVERQHQCLTTQLLPKLASHGVEIVRPSKLTAEESERMTAYFKEHLRPALTPILLAATHPFPLIRSHEIYLYVTLYNPKTRSKRHVLFLSPSTDRLIPLDEERLRFVTAEDVCLVNLGLVCHSMIVTGAHAFRVTRNTKISIDDVSFGAQDNLLDFVIEEVHRRRQAPVTRLEVTKSAPRKMVEHLKNELYLDDMDVYTVDTPFLDLSSCMSLAFIGLPWLRQTMRDPVVSAPFRGLTDRLKADPGAIFGVLRKRDVLVEFPKENFENSVILYLHGAARDPAVHTIKTVLYRGGSDSPIIAALIRAAKNGKEVSVVVELKASLDEVQNSEYARALQLAGCNVTYGVMGLKVHSKVMLVVRRELNGKLRTYANVSTGNFNPKTAKLYTDYSLFTCNKEICTDVLDVFNSLTGYSWKPDFRTLLVAPINMLSRFIDLIRAEAANAREGKPARIACQMNGLTDKQITKELYEASQAGVRIDLIVRGPCRLRPNIKGKSDNIRVYSWIGQILQHRRVYYFHAGGAGKYYIGSADWRTRNLTARVEVVVPVEDRRIKKRLSKSFDLINDHQWVWRMSPDGRYYKGLPTKSKPVSVSIAPQLSKDDKRALDTHTEGLGNRNDSGRLSKSPHQAMLDVMFDQPSPAIDNSKKLPSSVSDTTDEDSSTGKRSKPKFQVDIKGNKRLVDKIAVGAVPIRYVGGVESLETLEVLMVARGDNDPWAVPKGGRNEGEVASDAIIRIAREKAGVSRCEQVTNLGWIIVSKRTKQIAVQTSVLLTKELGTFASTRNDRRRTWMKIEDAISMLKTEMHDFSLSALERCREQYQEKFKVTDVDTSISLTSLAASIENSVPTSPLRKEFEGTENKVQAGGDHVEVSVEDAEASGEDVKAAREDGEISGVVDEAP